MYVKSYSYHSFDVPDVWFWNHNKSKKEVALKKRCSITFLTYLDLMVLQSSGACQNQGDHLYSIKQD